MMHVYIFICGVLTIMFFKFINKKITPPIFSIYSNPSKWYYLKMLVIYVLLKLRKFQNMIHEHGDNFGDVKPSAAGYGIKSRTNPDLMDCKQKLSSHPKAIDAVYFNLASAEAWNLVVGTALRPHGVVNGFIYLNVPGLGLLLSPKLPDTLMFHEETPGSDTSGYIAEGITIKPFMAMRTWRIQYVGKMRLDQSVTVEIDVELNGVWTSAVSVFDFDTDMDALAVARAMAREPWSQQYFKTVQDFHQTHYEQHGDFKGQAIINGQVHEMSMNGVRDHSYGRLREWKNFHRYGLHFITLEDGSRISVGIVCAPLVFSRLELGYMYLPDGSLHPVQSCNLQLHHHGENGCPPLDYAFSFQAGSKTYNVEVEVQHSPEFFVGWEWEARVVERLAKFKVNGISGWGAAEWEYRHTGNRPRELANNDPQWTNNIIKG